MSQGNISDPGSEVFGIDLVLCFTFKHSQMTINMGKKGSKYWWAILQEPAKNKRGHIEP